MPHTENPTADPTYALIMLAAVATGVAVFWRTRKPLDLTPLQTVGVVLGAFCGGMIGAKLPFVLADWEGLLSGKAWLDDGKTIMAGLVGGYLGVQIAEWAMDVRSKMCDGLAAPVAAAVAVGRLACYQAQCCFGAETSLPWGVVFNDDGVLRHPTQLYESAFHLTAAIVLYRLARRGIWQGQLVRTYFVSYFVYRFATEFIRPEPTLLLGLTAYQWAALVLGPLFLLWCPGCQPLRLRWRRPWRVEFEPTGGTTLKPTRTLCPVCLKPQDGVTFEQHGRVYVKRTCLEHGETTALVSSARRHYYLRDEAPHPPPGECCSPLPGHRTCVALLEITEACNLACPVCFAGSPSGRHRPIAELQADLATFLTQRGPLDILQLSGGEPLLHGDLLPLIDHCKGQQVENVAINTNGLHLLDTPELAAELAKRRPGLEIMLQLDSLDATSTAALRGADLLSQKRAVLDLLAKHDLPTTLVSTVVRGVNDDQLGPLVEMALNTPTVRGVTLQPATWSGRHDRATNPLDRTTLADVVDAMATQCNGTFRPDDFVPLPCSNPNCCSFTYVVRKPPNKPVPLTRLVDYREHLPQLADRINFNLADAQTCSDQRFQPDELLRVVIKPFMDAFTYDQDRIDECCIHIIQPGGAAVSFCQFNTLLRGRDNVAPTENHP